MIAKPTQIPLKWLRNTKCKSKVVRKLLRVTKICQKVAVADATHQKKKSEFSQGIYSHWSAQDS